MEQVSLSPVCRGFSDLYGAEVEGSGLVALYVLDGFTEHSSPLKVDHVFPFLMKVGVLLVHGLQLRQDEIWRKKKSRFFFFF